MLNIIHHGVLCNRSTSSIGIGLGNGGAVVVNLKSSKRSSACRARLSVEVAGTSSSASASAAGFAVAVLLASCFSCSTFTAAVLALDTAAETEYSTETLSNVPQTLSGDDCKKPYRIQRPKSRKAESCTIKCLTTCIRGGQGEGPLNVRRYL